MVGGANFFSIKEIVALLLFYLFSEVLFTLTAGSNNLYLLAPYVLGEYLVIASIFVKKMNQYRVWLIAGFALLIAVTTVERILGNDWLSISRALESILLMIAAGAWMRKTYSFKERKLERLPMFWFSIAILVYFVPSTPIFLSDSTLYTIDRATLLEMYEIKNALNVISKIVLAYSVYLWK